jgi:hypothetical protein
MSLPRWPIIPATFALCLLLAGCAAGGSYPSLLPRAAETGDTAPAPPPAPPVAASDPAIAARLTQLVEQSRQGQQQFETALGAADAQVARAGAAGSESWIAAQQAVSRLESARTPTVNALAELDAMAKTRAEAGIATAQADLGAIGSAEEQVRALAEAQEREISRLGSALSQP